jgi:hypothetical protein
MLGGIDVGDVLEVSIAGLSRAGSQVAATSTSANQGSAALAGVSTVISGPALGGSIGAAAAQFATTLAERCSKLTNTTTGHGSTIAQSAQVYTAADSSAVNGFQRAGGVLPGHPAI